MIVNVSDDTGHFNFYKYHIDPTVTSLQNSVWLLMYRIIYIVMCFVEKN